MFGDGEPSMATLLNVDGKEVDRPDAPPEAPEGGKARRAGIARFRTSADQNTVERLLLNEYGEPVLVTRGKNKVIRSRIGPAYRDCSADDDIAKYFEREFAHVPDAWIDESKTKSARNPVQSALLRLRTAALSEIDAELAMRRPRSKPCCGRWQREG